MTLSTIRLRRGIAAAWTSANPILAVGEPGWETDTFKGKIGDGITTWNALAYALGIVDGGAVNVKSAPYNAKGDGATDDTTAIHAARDAAGAGAQLLFPKGTYKTVAGLVANLTQAWVIQEGAEIRGTGAANPVTISASGVTIQGAGKINVNAGDTGLSGVFVNAGIDDARFDGVEITGGTYGVRVKGGLGTLCKRPTVTNCIIHDTVNGVFVNDKADDVLVHSNQIYNVGWGIGIVGDALDDRAGTCQRPIVTDNHLTNITSGEGVGIRSAPQGMVSNNTIQYGTNSGGIGVSVTGNSDYCKVIGNTVIAPTLYGVELSSSSRCVVSSNTILNSGDGGCVVNGAAVNYDENSFENNTILSPGNSGISLGSGKRGRAIGNYIYNPGNGVANKHGIVAGYNTGATGLLIANNSIYFATANAWGIVPDNPSAVVTGNVIAYASTLGASAGNGIAIADVAINSVVQDNTIQGNGKCDIGIFNAGTVTGCLVADNKIDGTTGSCIQWSSTSATNVLAGNVVKATSGNGLAVNAAVTQVGNVNLGNGLTDFGGGSFHFGLASTDGLGFYGATPISRAARAGQLTIPAGTPSTTTTVDVGAAFSQTTLNNNIATLATKINALETILHNLGLTS